MGQKIIPISLRLNKNENWHSKWIADKNEYSNLLHFDLELRKYFENIFNYKKFRLIKLNVVKTSKNINVYVYVHQHPQHFYKLPYNKIICHLNKYYNDNHIKLFIKNVKLEDLKKLKKTIGKIFRFIKKTNRVNFDMRKMIYNISYALYTKNIQMISNYIKQNLEKKKSHKKQIKLINNILQEFFKMFSNFLGYRLQFKGRLNGSKRKKKLVYQKGKIPLNTLKYDIKYHFNEFKTPSGVCSIKFWVFLKKI
jgi:small subunit ribosomal protein S3